MIIPTAIAEEVAEEAVQQEELEVFLRKEVEGGRALPGTYPPNEETLQRYARSKTP
jgi:regulator of RNase E activity RraA